jgi:predicted HicB family RNase H-like nuclease
MPAQPKPKKIGRPKLPKGEAKGKIVALRFNAEDRKRLEGAAKAKKLSVSDWIREAINAAF